MEHGMNIYAEQRGAQEGLINSCSQNFQVAVGKSSQVDCEALKNCYMAKLIKILPVL